MLQQFSNNSSGKYSQIENWVEYTITSDMPIHQMSSELNHFFPGYGIIHLQSNQDSFKANTQKL